jgi:hypothetical protein
MMHRVFWLRRIVWANARGMAPGDTIGAVTKFLMVDSILD